MKVLVVNNTAPFVWEGAEELATHLQESLIASGHEAEVLRIPFRWEPTSRIPSQMLMVRALEMYNVDRVIALKFPAYLIRHPHKTPRLLHQCGRRMIYTTPAKATCPKVLRAKRSDDSSETQTKRPSVKAEGSLQSRKSPSTGWRTTTTSAQKCSFHRSTTRSCSVGAASQGVRLCRRADQ